MQCLVGENIGFTNLISECVDQMSVGQMVFRQKDEEPIINAAETYHHYLWQRKIPFLGSTTFG
jgi:hypothetical protein